MKKLLLFMTDFYGYNQDIINELQNQGWEVTWYEDKVKFSPLELVWGKIYKNYKKEKFEKYFNNSLKQIEGNHFDQVLIIFAAGTFTREHVEAIRVTVPNTPVVYYSWDSIENFPRIKELADSADMAYTFDLKDSQKYGYGFLPLFYVNNSIHLEKEFDCSSIMSFNLSKVSGMTKLLNSIPDGNHFLFLRVPSKLEVLRMKLLDYKSICRLIPYFTQKSLKRDEVLTVFSKSKAVIDCPRDNQNGLTMRTFEVLSLGVKLITTNENIKKYDFYTPQNIFVVDDENTKVSKDFLDSSFDKKFSFGEEYSLSRFVKKLTKI